MGKKLKIKLLPSGIIEMETVGIKGKKCMEYTKFMEDLVNGKIQEQKFTDEYYQEEELYNNNDNNQNLYEKY